MDIKDKVEEVLREFNAGVNSIPRDMPLDKVAICYSQLVDDYSDKILGLFS